MTQLLFHVRTHTHSGHTGLRALHSEWSSTLVPRSKLALITLPGTHRKQEADQEVITPQPPFEPPHTELVTISTAKQTVAVVRSEHQTGQKGKGLQLLVIKAKA